MTETALAATEDGGADIDDGASRVASHRGRFAIFEAPVVPTPPSISEAEAMDLSTAADDVDHAALAEQYGEETVHATITDMIRAIVPGLALSSVFAQDGPDGMSLAHAWFGPNFPLFRHCHPKLGDCLYYILAGEVHLGSRVLGAGGGFFVPNGMPYKFRAGPAGVEILEFRAGGGIADAPATRMEETSLDGIRRITELAIEQHETWTAETAPARVSSGPLR